MASKFNFTTKLGLDADGFKQGVRGVQNSIRSLKSSFLSLAGALGAGLGFNQLISNLKNTATELSVAKNTLKNVSYVTEKHEGAVKELNIEVTNYKENLEFVKRLSNDYAQDLVAVTDNYAKFTAACKKTDLALEDQKFVFESLTKAAAYYHLSADRTSDMMNAVTQMMSKGKVAAEELRRQLGNTLPGAFNMMAAAMGVSNKELDEMLRSGKVVAADVLPRFAAMLNSVTQTAEFDSLQSSMNKFKNTWYEVVEASNAENIFKGIIDGGTKALSWTANNMKGIKSSIVGLLAYIASVNIFGHFHKQGEIYIASLERDLKKAQQMMGLFSGEMKRLEKEQQVNKSSTGVVTPLVSDFGDPRVISRIQKYNDALLEAAKTQIKLGTITKAEFDKIQNEVNQATAAITGMNAAAKNVKPINKLGIAWKGLGTTISKITQSVKAFFASNWVFILIGAITALWNRAKQAREEIERIRNISKEYANESAKVKGSVDEQASKLRNNLKLLKEAKLTEKERLYVLNQINNTMGLVGKHRYTLDDLNKIKGKYSEIVEEVEKWIAATKEEALVQHYANQIAEITANKTDAIRAQQDAWKIWSDWESGGDVSIEEGVKAKKAWQDANAKIAQYDKAIETTTEDMRAASIEAAKFWAAYNDKTGNGGDGGEYDPAEGLSKIMEKYNQDTKKLSNQLKEGAITQEEYNAELNKIIQEAYKAAAATGEISMEAILKKQDSGKSLTALEKWYVELKKKALECAQQVVLDGIAKSIIEDIDEALAKEAEELEKEFEKILENEEKRRQVDIDYAGATSELKYQNSRNKRDGTFDYKKSRADIFGEEADIANENLDRVMDKIEELNDKQRELMETTGQGLDEVAKKELSSLQEYYRQLSKEAKTIEEAYRFEQIKEDIKEFEQEMASTVFGGIENFATSLDRVVSGAKQLRDIMENTDSTGWEKIMGVVNYIFNILNAVTSIIETVNTLTEISNMLAGARAVLDEKKKTDLITQNEALALQAEQEGVITGMKVTQAIADTASVEAEKNKAKAILGVTTALGVEAAAYLVVAEAAKKAAAATAAVTAAAGGPAAAIAAAETTLMGLTAVLSTFEHGGIVGGNSTRGDRNIVRVNSGEMILNKAQQGTLFNMLNGKGGVGGNVEFKIKGADLVGTINNYNSRKRG